MRVFRLELEWNMCVGFPGGGVGHVHVMGGGGVLTYPCMSTWAGLESELSMVNAWYSRFRARCANLGMKWQPIICRCLL